MKPFIAWDGEGVEETEEYHPFALFGASTGERIKYVDLSTFDCLNLIIQVGGRHDGIHVSFSFGYDVNMIFKDLPVRALHMLRTTGKCWWNGFAIEHIPRKWIIVRRKGVSVKIFDAFLFFNCKFGVALRKYGIGTPEDLDRIDKMKEERPHFKWEDIDEIELYWETELKYLVQLMDKLREIIYGADFRITSWHGPGALASYALGKYNTNLYMDRGSPDEIIDASRYAMFGGRFQAFMAGFYEGPIYERDINSAYAYSFSRLPSLATGKWVHTYYPDREDIPQRRLGLYRIRYNARWSNGYFPLPHRDIDGKVSYPPATIGWFHAPEAAIVRNDPNAEFLEAWIFEDDGTYPFEWIEDAFHERQLMQERGDPCEKTIKWMLAALYGQAAQRAGWMNFRGPPKWHQLEWAGAVTSECRSMLYSASIHAKSSLVTVDTDGFISLAPVNKLPNGVGNGLGQWKCTIHTAILYLQNGIYWLRDEQGNWQEPKSRGIPRKKLKFEDVYEKMLKNEELEVSQHMFIGYGLALRGQMQKWRKWVDVPRTIHFGGNGKAFHDEQTCKACRNGESWGTAMHPLYMAPPKTIESHPYDLPWLHPDDYEARVLKNWTET